MSLLVTGYIRKYMCNKLNLCKTLLYYFGEELICNYGKYEWNIDMFSNKLIISPVFVVSHLKWIIKIKKKNGSLILCVEILTIPKEWKSILASVTIQCEQTKCQQTRIINYSETNTVHAWPKELLHIKLSTINSMNINELNIIIQINILRIITQKNNLLYQQNMTMYEQNDKIEWTIDKETMKMMKNCIMGQCFENNINANQIFYLSCFPNGTDSQTKGDVRLFLCIRSFPSNILSLRVQFTLYCIEENIFNTNITQLKSIYELSECKQCAEWDLNCLSFDNFKKHNNITFGVNVLILNEYDFNGNCKMIKQAKKNLNSDSNIDIKFKQMETRLETMEQSVNKLTSEVQSLSMLVSKQVPLIRNANNISTEPRSKARNNVYLWLKNTVNLEEYYQVFIDSGFENLHVIKRMSMNVLEQIGIHKIGHRMILQQHIGNL
eukprot:178246_1